MYKKEIKWSDERRTSLIIQRNFLLLFVSVLSTAVLISLFLIKKLNDERKVEPYLIEYNKIDGTLAVIDSSTKKEYTAQESVIESLAVEYIKSREGLNMAIIEDNINKIRVFSLKEVYKSFLDEIATKISNMQAMGKNARVNITINSITHLAKNKIEIKFKSQLVNDVSSQNIRYLKAIIVFEFYDGEMIFEDRVLNPLNYQVTFYKIFEEKKVEQEDQENKATVYDNPA